MKSVCLVLGVARSNLYVRHHPVRRLAGRPP